MVGKSGNGWHNSYQLAGGHLHYNAQSSDTCNGGMLCISSQAASKHAHAARIANVQERLKPADTTPVHCRLTALQRMHSPNTVQGGR